MKRKNKLIKLCMWCGTAHWRWSEADQEWLKYKPQDCVKKDLLMSEAVKIAEPWLVMQMLETHGSDSLFSYKTILKAMAAKAR